MLNLKVPVTIGGEERFLFYPNGALTFIRANAPKTNDEEQALYVLICAGLLHQQRDLTVEDLKFTMLPTETQAAAEAAHKALTLASPKVGASRPPEALPLGGKRAGRSHVKS